MVCELPLCKAIAELNKDIENNVQPESERYGETWKAYLSASGDRGMINDLPCSCEHKHFVRRKR